jgi:hypothetical protein
LTVDDLLHHDRDSRGEPETHRQGDQQEGGEGPEAEPEAAPWSSRRLWGCGSCLLDEVLVNGGPQPPGYFVLRQGGAEQPLETPMDGHLRLGGVASLEMLSYLVGLRRGELPIEIKIELRGGPLA